MRHVTVGDSGIAITSVWEPVCSMFGTVIDPCGSEVLELPWEQITRVSVDVLVLPPDGERRACLTIDLDHGDFIEVGAEDSGFAEALTELCRRSARAVPDLRTMSPDEQPRIWPPTRDGEPYKPI